MNNFEDLEFYAVRNKAGQWFHRRGNSGSGEIWREDVREARIYNKIGSARSQVTFFAEKYPSYGVPEIVCFKVGEVVVINEEDRLKKKQEREDKRAGIRRIKNSRAKLACAQSELKEEEEVF